MSRIVSCERCEKKATLKDPLSECEECELLLCNNCFGDGGFVCDECVEGR